MNFDFLKNCEIKDEWMRGAYAGLLGKLERAERVYRNNPQECGIILREAAEDICRIYNAYYQIGFDVDAVLEEFLCYTDDDAHNAMVSRFLSAVRKEQRDRLIRLRVLGDDCDWGAEANEPDSDYYNRMTQDAKRMMEAMVETLKTMCRKLNGLEGLEELRFLEEKLPVSADMPTEPSVDGAADADKGAEKKKSRSFLSRLFRK